MVNGKVAALVLSYDFCVKKKSEVNGGMGSIISPRENSPKSIIVSWVERHS